MKTKKYGNYFILCLMFVSVAVMLSVPLRSAAESTQKPPDANRMEPDSAPTPFSAEEIRANCQRGRTIVFQLETFGKPLLFKTMTFGTESKDGTVIENVTTGVDGKVIGKKEYVIAKWTELQAHGSFSQAQTEIKTEQYTTPAGTFDCWLYIVKTDKDHKGEERCWFAKSMPGPPICFEQSEDGQTVFRVTMLKSTK
jgi:hypothetical protein